MSNGKTVFIALAAAILCAAPTGAHGALRVVTSTADFAAIAREVGGGLVEVESIAAGDQDPHFVELLPSYMIRVRKADVYVKVGLELDYWAQAIIDGSRNSRLEIVDCAKSPPMESRLEVPTQVDIFFLLILFLFGTTSGMAIFTAQYWGKRDLEPIRKVLGLCIAVSVAVALLCSIAATLIPETVLGFYTNDPEVIRLGASYLRIVGLSYVLVAISTSYISVLRSMEIVKLAVVITVMALIIKTAIGYTLIFGLFGLPALGVRGAAIGTMTGWIFECLAILVAVYAFKTPLAANPLTFFNFERAFVTRLLKTVFPATANEVIWSLGITIYNMVYAHIGTDAIEPDAHRGLPGHERRA